jgi:hypothetical protein
MKKLLLFSLIIGFALSTFAQNKMVSMKSQKRVKSGLELVNEKPITKPLPEFNHVKAVNEDVTAIMVGTAASQRGLRREEAHMVSYDWDLDVISVTDVLDPATYEGVDEYGVIGMWYSSDHGQTWNGPVQLFNDLSINPSWYVAGALYNPEGNTTIDNMYGVSQGTLNMGGGDWNYKIYGSSSLAGENQTNYLYASTGDDGYWNIFGLGQTGNIMRCLNLIPGGPWGGYTSATLQPIIGEFNGETFDWDFSSTVEVNLFNESDGVMSWIGMWQGMDAGVEIAWSNDGEIGYMWVVGVSSEDPSGYQPIVFRTEDAGDSWDYIFLDFQDNDIQDILEPYVIENSVGDMVPHIKESAGVVDVNGELQIMVGMGSSAADVFTYPDSVGSYWVYPGDLFNVTVDENGIAGLLWVDSLRTSNVVQATEGNYCGNTGWQHRISAAKSQDESQVFFTWIDTRDNVNNEDNIHPDLFGWSRYVGSCGNAVEMDYTICFSEGAGDLEEHFYFNSGSDKAYFNGESYTVPYIQGVSPIEFLTNTSSSNDPITLSYVTGIEFPDLCITGVEESALANSISVTQNMPNPFTGFTVIEVSTKTAASVTVEISNIMGQSIYTIDAGIINGTQKIELSAENLEAGIYFYTVQVGNERITNKMIVE